MNKDWKHVEEHFQKKLNCWRIKMLLVGGRLVILNSILSSLLMFMLSFFMYLRGFEEVYVRSLFLAKRRI
jgi:hypothetical protein